MGCPHWDDVRDDWESVDDPALRDIYVFSTPLADWQRVVAAIRARGWAESYTEDGKVATMPSDVRDVFERGRQRAICWKIRLVDQVEVRCHFFSPDEIEFDLNPQQVLGQEHLDGVCAFIGAVGEASEKPVVVTWENAPADVILRYDPYTAEVRRPGQGP